METSDYRIERDSMGEVRLPADVLYGAQTQRALDNFTISEETLPWDFLSGLLHIKLAAATANSSLGLLAEEMAQAISAACQSLLTERTTRHFPVSVYQTGSGTSTNMNVNEVIAQLARQQGVDVHPNDHVNLGQSSNDVIPATISISATVRIEQRLLPALRQLILVIKRRAAEHEQTVTTGRTHLMDALPMRLADEFSAWALQLEEGLERLQDSLVRLRRLPLGGTAIGSGVNCHPEFAGRVLEALEQQLSIRFTPLSSPFKGISSIDTPLEVSGQLKTCAMSLFKIANDLRWMNSGPNAGLGEISLPALQPGSSIMPAKVNPVIPEAVCMAAAQVAGYDCAITLAAQAGNFQLNTMLPLVGRNLLSAIGLLAGSCDALATKALNTMQVNVEKCAETLAYNPILVTALNPVIGYQRAAEIGKIASKEKRTVLDVALEHTDIERQELEKLLDPARLAAGNRN